MILFVFEGDEREPRLYRTLERLYFPKQNENIICSFGNNIYDLYNELQEYDGEYIPRSICVNVLPIGAMRH